MVHGKPENLFLDLMPTTDIALVILAGGIGSRFGGSKQVQPFGMRQRFLFEYACYDAMQAGFKKVFIVVKPGMSKMIAQQLDTWIQAHRYEISVQEQSRTKPWGTAHALHFLNGKWEAPFLVLNADDYYGPSICQRAAAFVQQGIHSAALVYELGPTLSPHGPVARGLCQISNQQLCAIEEVLQIQEESGQIKDHDGRIFASDTFISMNAWLLPGSFLKKLSVKVNAFLELHKEDETIEVYLTRVINEMIGSVEVHISVAVMPAAWFGITYAADLVLAKQRISELETSHYPLDFPVWI